MLVVVSIMVDDFRKIVQNSPNCINNKVKITSTAISSHTGGPRYNKSRLTPGLEDEVLHDASRASARPRLRFEAQYK